MGLKMDLGISGKTALVLGGAVGLGSVIATALKRKGASVVIADRDVKALHAVEERLVGLQADCRSENRDPGDLNAIDEMIESIESRLGSTDILVNYAGGPPLSAA